MDSTGLMSIQPTSLIPLDGLSGTTLGRKIENLQADEIDNVSEEKKKQIAKDFESLLITKLLDQVKDTIGHGGFEQDSSSDQVQGIFWLYLANDIANNGGFGLWKDLYEFMRCRADVDEKWLQVQ